MFDRGIQDVRARTGRGLVRPAPYKCCRQSLSRPPAGLARALVLEGDHGRYRAPGIGGPEEEDEARRFRRRGLTVILLVTVFVSSLKPAAPSVDKATLWPDVVKTGPDGPPGARHRHAGARGHALDSGDHGGPRREDPACGQARRCMPDTVIVELASPELEQAVDGGTSEARIGAWRSSPTSAPSWTARC